VEDGRVRVALKKVRPNRVAVGVFCHYNRWVLFQGTQMLDATN
jgi:hypothetical protein